MRESGSAIRDLPVVERKPPEAGALNGKIVAFNDTNVALATASNTFVILPVGKCPENIEIGERIAVRIRQGRATLLSGTQKERQ
jgi:hypothetical protein